MDALDAFLVAEFLGKANWVWLSFITWSLAITVGLISGGVLYSLWKTRKPLTSQA